MFIKKFEALTFEEGLQKIKNELGPDALILKTEKIKSGIFGRDSIQITAASKEKKSVQEPKISQKTSKELTDLNKIFPHRRAKNSNALSAKKKYIEIADEMKSETRPVVRKNTVVEDFTRLGISAGVAQELSRTCFLGTKARDESGHEFIDIKKRVISQRVQTIPLENLLTSKRISMVGTAGSGKTMGLVKLALMLKKKKVDVCFSSLDSRKVTSQLEMSQYGKILRVPIKEIDKKSAHEVQLIDTPSLRLDSEESNWLLVKQLGGVPTSVLLCLEATMRLTEMIRVYELTKRFFAVEAFFISKLDLTMLSGAIVDLSVQTRIPICGVNSSQSYNSPLNFYNSTELSDVILQRGAFR